MSGTPDPRETLDYAMTLEPGTGVILDFETVEEARAFRGRCYALRGSEARQARKLFAPEEEGWGKHPWLGVSVVRCPPCDHRLWIGRPAQPKVRVGTLADAMGASIKGG